MVQGFGSLSSYIVKMYLLYLVKTNKIAYRSTAHQVFTSFLQNLGEHYIYIWLLSKSKN